MTTVVDIAQLGRPETGSSTGTVCEPSVAVSGHRRMITGNWFASRSTDGGTTWEHVDPFTEFPASGPGFCCDQLVHYSRSRRLWIWLLQYRKDGAGNIVRIAVSSTGAPGTWTWWDTRPTDVDPAWDDVWFDYPDLVETDDKLAVSFNVFGVADDRWRRAVVLRFSLDELKARGAIGREAWSTDRIGSLRFAKGAGADAVFAGHDPTQFAVVVFSWADSAADAAAVQPTSVPVRAWNQGPYLAASPDGGRWLDRLDDRITAGWRTDDQIGFAWSASADATHPLPFVRVVRLRPDDLTVIDEPDLWSSDCAWAYPAAAANGRGDVGVTAFCGGGSSFPAHAVGWLDPDVGTWVMTTATASTHGPGDGKWGDYIDLLPDPTRTTYWIASGFTLDGGNARTNVRPQVVTFKP
ncbi:hypothetical protein [Ilumatobacter nonamiensis]|uniref:hypothetical protein n=1 Tax=Ilumatobacter nonamiensis TaxID=467093 RepID=UPI00034BD3BD|nr:hypothetical protein [Ilumatobacter nonamiensis]